MIWYHNGWWSLHYDMVLWCPMVFFTLLQPHFGCFFVDDDMGLYFPTIVDAARRGVRWRQDSEPVAVAPTKGETGEEETSLWLAAMEIQFSKKPQFGPDWFCKFFLVHLLVMVWIEGRLDSLCIHIHKVRAMCVCASNVYTYLIIFICMCLWNHILICRISPPHHTVI